MDQIPAEPGLGKELKELEAGGFFVGSNARGFWWWESEWGTRHDPIPVEAEGPYPTIGVAIAGAKHFRDANPA